MTRFTCDTYRVELHNQLEALLEKGDLKEYVCGLNIDGKRNVLLAIEQCIMQRAGMPDELFGFPSFDTMERQQLRKLIEMRCVVLNEMMVHPTEAEVKRLEYQNNRLLQLMDDMYEQVRNMELMFEENKVLFEDELEQYSFSGLLEYVYYNENSVERLDNDDFYESDFNYMHHLILQLIEEGCYTAEIVHISDSNRQLCDINTCKSEYLKNDAYKSICVCSALDAVCRSNIFSIPDVLRINRFGTRASLNYCHSHKIL